MFITGFTPPRNENTKISIQSSLDMNLKSSDVKLDWLLNKEDLPLYLESIKQSSILLSKNFWIYNTNDGDEYQREDDCIYYKVQLLNGLKFQLPTIGVLILNKFSNQGVYDAGVGLDFTFVVDGKKIRASKFILSLSSKVF